MAAVGGFKRSTLWISGDSSSVDMRIEDSESGGLRRVQQNQRVAADEVETPASIDSGWRLTGGYVHRCRAAHSADHSASACQELGIRRCALGSTATISVVIWLFGYPVYSEL